MHQSRFVVEDPDGESCQIEEIDLRSLGRLVSSYGLPDLPWQISGETLAQLTPPFRAFCYKDAYVAISSSEESQIAIRSLLIMPEAHERENGLDLLKGLFARYPEKTWRVPAIFPEEFSTIFDRAGFEREELSQFQMAISLVD